MSKQSKLRGTVWERPNGTWTLQAEPTWDAKTGQYRRPSLGTYATREEAEQAQIEYSTERAVGL